MDQEPRPEIVLTQDERCESLFQAMASYHYQGTWTPRMSYLAYQTLFLRTPWDDSLDFCEPELCHAVLRFCRKIDKLWRKVEKAEGYEITLRELAIRYREETDDIEVIDSFFDTLDVFVNQNPACEGGASPAECWDTFKRAMREPHAVDFFFKPYWHVRPDRHELKQYLDILRCRIPRGLVPSDYLITPPPAVEPEPLIDGFDCSVLPVYPDWDTILVDEDPNEPECLRPLYDM